jgi:predicted membrane chloride channel (bestrophin family)
MSRYLSILNYRTLITLMLSLIVPLVAYQFKVVYNIDLTLMSIAIIFPLVFTIRGAFRRREKALEHLSLYRAGLKTVENLIQFSPKIDDQVKLDGQSKINKLSNALYNHLTTKNEDPSEFDNAYEGFLDYMRENSDTITGGSREKIFRFLKDVLDSADNLIAIHSHRTPISLKAYCLIFIYIFPVIYTPTIINKIGIDNPSWLTFFIVILSEFILISLYNIQDQMEHPFDDDGLDDIKLKLFSIKRK